MGSKRARFEDHRLNRVLALIDSVEIFRNVAERKLFGFLGGGESCVAAATLIDRQFVSAEVVCASTQPAVSGAADDGARREFENGGTSYLILSHIPFSELGLPNLPETPVNEVSEKVMEMTIPFAVSWATVLSGVAAGVHMYNKKKEEKSVEVKAEVTK